MSALRQRALAAERQRDEALARAQAAEQLAACALGGKPPEPPPEFVLAYEAPQRRRFQAVALPGGNIIVLDRDVKGKRSAADVWADLVRHSA